MLSLLRITEHLQSRQGLKFTENRHSSTQRSNCQSSKPGSTKAYSTVSETARQEGMVSEIECRPGSHLAVPELAATSNVSLSLSSSHSVLLPYSPLGRSDSGVGLPSAPPGSPFNGSPSSSTTTVAPQAYDQLELGGMRFPAKPFSM